MILGSWLRQELTDYPGNGRGGGVMVSQGQIQPLTATFVKFCSCARSAEIHPVQWKYSRNTVEALCANTCSPAQLLTPAVGCS